MNCDFTAFNPYVWLIFVVFLVSTFLIVKLYHYKHPNYPYNSNNDPGGKDFFETDGNSNPTDEQKQ